jgi:hypothetical protein
MSAQSGRSRAHKNRGDAALEGERAGVGGRTSACGTGNGREIHNCLCVVVTVVVVLLAPLSKGAAVVVVVVLAGVTRIRKDAPKALVVVEVGVGEAGGVSDTVPGLTKCRRSGPGLRAPTRGLIHSCA